jgi:DNA-binding MarR family transcriptional regulator
VARRAPDPAQTSAPSTDGWLLAEVVTRMRRALRFGLRSEYPWERLPMAQVELLQRLSDEPGLRVSELADRHRLAPNTVSNLVQQMVQAGLVERRGDAVDRRAVTIELTGVGRTMLQGWLAANSRHLEAALERLSPSDRRVVIASVPAWSRLVQQLEQPGDEPVAGTVGTAGTAGTVGQEPA